MELIKIQVHALSPQLLLKEHSIGNFNPRMREQLAQKIRGGNNAGVCSVDSAF